MWCVAVGGVWLADYNGLRSCMSYETLVNFMAVAPSAIALYFGLAVVVVTL
jgi:ABC-type phosphate transport system permease subunit